MWVSVLLGCLLILGGKLYCLFAHPEWTDAMQFFRLWWLWLLAVLLILIPATWARMKDGVR